ncbi:MAG: Sapep family Mn(2+)-dependent dipeptidase, partial [Eubacteriales bacterium]|nr:Sapep family Mn(2+)-dependent dipeptidase [Eubacteriales bacterium]
MLLDEKLYAKICEWVDAHKEEYIADLQSFCRIKSVSREDLAEPGAPFGKDCRKMLDYALKRCEEYGFETCDNEGYFGDAWSGERKTSVGIIGHLDVVPEGDGWAYPPYEPTRVGDFLIGRGVGDNKNACVMGLYVMRMLRDIEAPLTNGVRVILGCSEETGMQDMVYLVENNLQAPVSLVPDAGFPVNYAQKGMVRGEMSIPTGSVLVSFSGGEVRNMVPPHAKAQLNVCAKEAQQKLDDTVSVEECEGGCIVRAVGKAAHAAGPENGESALLKLSTALAASGLLDEASQKAIESIREMCSDYHGGNAGIACEDPETGKTTMVCGVAATENGRITLSLDCRLSIATDLAACEASLRSFGASLGF